MLPPTPEISTSDLSTICFNRCVHGFILIAPRRGAGSHGALAFPRGIPILLEMWNSTSGSGTRPASSSLRQTTTKMLHTGMASAFLGNKRISQ